MAAGVVPPKPDDGLSYNGGVTAFVLLSCAVAATGGMIFGYDNGVTGGVISMEPFLEKFFPGIYREMAEESSKISNYCRFDSQILTLFTSSLFLAGLVASLFSSRVTRSLGRRASILIGGAAFLAGAFISAAAVHVSMLIAGRLWEFRQSVPLYLSEMAPPRYRGAFNTAFQLCIGVGSISAQVINYFTNEVTGGWGWRVSLAMAAAPAAVLTIGGLYLPETPNSLVENGSTRENAEKLLRRIRGVDDVDEELNDLIAASEAARTVNRSFQNLLRRKYRPQLVMAVAFPFFQQLTGINVVTFYTPILFRTIGSGISASLLAAVIISVTGSTLAVLSMAIVDKIGRRPLLIAGGIQMITCQLIIGYILTKNLGDYGDLSKEQTIAIIVLMSVYTSGFALSWGPLAWLVTSEIFPLEIRSAGQSVSTAMNLAMIFAVAQGFLAMLCHFKAGVFFFFAASVTAMTAFVYWWLPETKGMPIEKMERIWREHWYWRRFVEKGTHSAVAFLTAAVWQQIIGPARDSQESDLPKS